MQATPEQLCQEENWAIAWRQGGHALPAGRRPCPAALRLPVVSARLSSLLPSTTFVQRIIGLMSEYGRSANGLEALKDG